jgi:hypothetical protein
MRDSKIISGSSGENDDDNTLISTMIEVSTAHCRSSEEQHQPVTNKVMISAQNSRNFELEGV